MTLVNNDLALAMRLVLAAPANGMRDRWSDAKVAALLDTREEMLDHLHRWVELASRPPTKPGEIYDQAAATIALLARLEGQIPA